MVLLSFDIEEFDMPLEYSRELSFEDQIAVSVEGTRSILRILDKYGAKATFFSTANFANHAQELVTGLVASGHELASHGYFHTGFETAHLHSSRQALEQLIQQPVRGFRMARMMPVDEKEVANAGYLYNTSINPTFIPGRYNRLKSPRTHFIQDGVMQIPASVSPGFRVPLFWLSFHNFPLSYYKWLCKRTYKKDGYLNLYFHPWEFTDLKQTRYGLPGYVSRNSGQQMIERFESLLAWMKEQQYSFGTFQQFISLVNQGK